MNKNGKTNTKLICLTLLLVRAEISINHFGFHVNLRQIRVTWGLPFLN